MSVFFNGRLITTPTSASMVDDSGMFNKNISVGNVTAIIGRSAGGKPFSPLSFGSPDDAKAALMGDINTIKAIEKAFDPSSETNGASSIVFIRVNPAVQASGALMDASGAQVISLASADYGAYTNQIKYKIETGSNVGKKVTTQLGNSYFAADNIARNALQVINSDTNPTATMSVAATLVTLKSNGNVVAAIDLNAFPTIQQLADRISAVPGFTASVLDGNGGKPALNGLDFVTDVSVKNTGFTVTATLQAIVDWLNGTSEQYIVATRLPNAGTLPANIGYTYLAGGSDGVVTNNEWQMAFSALQNVDVQWVVPLSPSAAIIAMADSHVAFMSTVGKRERRCISGGDISASDADGIAAAKALNSDRTSYMHIGFYDYDANGNLTLFPAYVFSALIAGMFSGVNPGEPLTNKSVKIRGLERNPRNPIDTDPLIQGGVLCVENTNSGYRVVKSISTWLNNANYNRVEQSCGVACDFVVRNVREAMDAVRGKKGSPLTLKSAYDRAKTRLDELSRPEPMGPGVLVGDEQNPPYKNLSVSLDGDVIRAEYQCSPVIPVNYILQVAHAVPYSGSVSV